MSEVIDRINKLCEEAKKHIGGLGDYSIKPEPKKIKVKKNSLKKKRKSVIKHVGKNIIKKTLKG